LTAKLLASANRHEAVERFGAAMEQAGRDKA
jgi:hypothetical protein